MISPESSDFTRVFDADLKAAGIPKTDAQGRTLDIHCQERVAPAMHGRASRSQEHCDRTAGIHATNWKYYVHAMAHPMWRSLQGELGQNMLGRNTTMRISIICLAMASVVYGQRVPPVPQTRPAGATLRRAAGEKLLVGTAVMSFDLRKPGLAPLIAEQFGCLTAGNEMKPDALQRVKGRFTFERPDRMVAFAEEHDMQVIGHTLCWHQQTPKWMFQDDNGRPLPRDVALANLKTHIETVVKHFKGKVKGWDVVNEAVNDGPQPYLRDTPARRAIGDDFVLKAFEFAHQADPNVELYYNDYNIELDYKRDRALRLIRQIKAAGLRIDGVGIQGHWMLGSPSVAEIERGIRAYTAEGLKVMITEMDIDVLPRRRRGGADLNATERQGLNPYRAGLPDDVQEKLAQRYGDLFGLFMRYPQITRVTLWGTSDGDTWLNNFPVRGRTNHPMLFDRRLRLKPAFHAVIKALQSAKPDNGGTSTPNRTRSQ
ncbi:MAG: endo-1,4-beta-xylanase [Phycisphaerae bacterium]